MNPSESRKTLNSEKLTMEQTNTEPKRMTPFNLWILLGAAAVAHLILIAVFSPGLFLGEDDSPEALVKKARELRDNGKYQKAMETYYAVIRQKPPVPAVFEVAEQEMQETRIAALNAEREAAENAARQEAEQQKNETSPQNGTPQSGTTGTTETPESPPDLPALPSLDDDL